MTKRPTMWRRDLQRSGEARRGDEGEAGDSLYRRYGKRALDLGLAVPALAVLSPLLLTVGAAVRLRLGAPVLFRQQRPGLHGQPFEMLKFRSMDQRRDSYGALLPDEQRLGRFGRLLRSSSLDELPALLNVVRGDMSLVGPRPLLMQYLSRYSAQQARRHEVRPGITGLAQVCGRNSLSWDAKFALDVDYVDRLSLGLDLMILAQTLTRVLRRDGITAAGHATMPEFLGPEFLGNLTTHEATGHLG